MPAVVDTSWAELVPDPGDELAKVGTEDPLVQIVSLMIKLS